MKQNVNSLIVFAVDVVVMSVPYLLLYLLLHLLLYLLLYLLLMFSLGVTSPSHMKLNLAMAPGVKKNGVTYIL